MSLSTAQLNQRLAIVKQKAKKAGIPWEILWGVEGVETTHGNNITTSSAGARGPFQFIAPTAKQWKYPYTNQQTPQIYAQQAESAADYLASLFHEHGSWDAALRAYSGGGYGLAKVKEDSEGTQVVPGGFVKGSLLAAPVEAVAAPVEAAKSALEFLQGKGVVNLLITGVLLIAGALLAAYGILVAVRPRESAFSIPFLKAIPV